MKDYHYECMIIVLTHLVAEAGDLINYIQDRDKCEQGRFEVVVAEKFTELTDILNEAEEIWEDN